MQIYAERSNITNVLITNLPNSIRKKTKLRPLHNYASHN